MTAKNERTLTFNPNTTIQQTLSTISGLGNILITVKQSQLAESKTQTLVTTQNESKASSQSASGNKTSDLTKSGQVSNPEKHQLVQEYQLGPLSNPDPIIKVKSSKKYSVKIVDDKYPCCIIGICETASGELLITDEDNRKVKLLDKTYKVVAHYDLPWPPWSMCSIDSSLVALTLSNKEVHFIKVANGQVIKYRILKLEHRCIGIAHHHGNLYITDGSALYLDTMDGRLVREMYKDTSGPWTVTTCAVSPDGDRIYVVNKASEQLVTLSRDGTVISILTDYALGVLVVLPGLHVTDSGQVLVCGYGTSTIFQVDKDGRQTLADVVTKNDDVSNPLSVYYRKNTGSIIVGMRNNAIKVFEKQ
ncbi:hypothetical protein DPMN_063565 [Dreissena polymorpha]|uniref:Uncharacterized protein n=1 Tax=Dreissena polymorpha TaxID=45954 RepID=A0A9D4HJ86_DREPO|nr:hypothetical protein DPMN_063565 [Dreissena polymorpha]